VVVDYGAIKLDGTPREVFAEAEQLAALHLDVPQATKLANALPLKNETTVLNAAECADALYQNLQQEWKQ
jgi:hypothetical protein